MHPRSRANQIEFDDFYRQHWSALVRLAWTLTGRRALAEEIAQDAMLSAHRQWSRVRLYDRPDLWVRRATVNRCTSAFRRASREARLLLRLGSRLRDGDPPTEPLPEIWRDVARLPRRQAQVIALRYLEDRSVSDIAAALKLGDETVRTHLRRAHVTLAHSLDNLDEDPR
jgi:RNA polymerase sigma-70 factor (ECF subfamily)